jgi:hypothetical protein
MVVLAAIGPLEEFGKVGAIAYLLGIDDIHDDTTL